MKKNKKKETKNALKSIKKKKGNRKFIYKIKKMLLHN